MKYCTNCGKEVAEGNLFCAECGAPVDAVKSEEAAIAEEKECLDFFYRFFKYERLAWKIFGIVWVAFAAFFLVFGILFGGIGAIEFGLNTPADEMAFGVLSGTYVFLSILYLPIGIINLCMVKRARFYMDTIYTDVCPAIVRLNSVGMIVFSAMFNTLAMVFIIINFARAKSSKEMLNRIAKRQHEFKEQQTVNV